MKPKNKQKEIAYTKDNGKDKSIKKTYNIVKRFINHDITKEITFNEADLSYNNPNIIIYKNIQFKICTKDYFDKMYVTWNCINKRRQKNKTSDLKQFCN